MAEWSCGLITVPSRRETLLEGTLGGLRRAGFPDPRLFVDGRSDNYDGCLNAYAKTFRDPVIRAYANWVLGLWEIYARQPRADFFAMFQDDVVFCRDLRAYCEAFSGWARGERAYLNLYTAEGMPAKGNVELSRAAGRDGWFRSNQLGSGALALVFPNHAVRALLGSKLMAGRPYDDLTRGWNNIDGAVSEALCRSEQRRIGEPYTEWCHRPSLVQHAGEFSTIDKRRESTDHDPAWIAAHPFRWPAGSGAPDFPGEDWSPLTLLGEEARDVAAENAKNNKPPAPQMTPAEWAEERERIRAAMAADTLRLNRAKTPADVAHFERWIAEYRARLAAHEARRPGAVE